MSNKAAPLVAIIYVQPGGEYYKRTQVDLWPEAHDARRYAGPYPVVAHPPCNRWCCPLSRLVESQHPNDPHYAVGADGGTFRSALRAVRRWGGVREHPAFTYAWEAHKLVRPPAGGGWLKTGEREWVCQVAQAAYGHPARKLTWLLYVGRQPPPELDWSIPKVRAWVSLVGKGQKLPHGFRKLSKREANATPPRFADLLIELALHSRCRATKKQRRAA